MANEGNQKSNKEVKKTDSSKQSTPVKKTEPAKQNEPVKKTESVKQTEPVKKTEPAKQNGASHQERNGNAKNGAANNRPANQGRNGAANNRPVNQEKRGNGKKGDGNIRYYPRSFLWNILSVTLAFLFGIFAALGGLIGVGIVFVTKKPVKDLLGEQYLSYIREDYANDSVYDLIADIIGTVKEIATSSAEFSFQSINKITPILENFLTPLSESLGEIGISLDVDEFMNTPVRGFGSFLSTTLRKTELGGIIKPDSSSALMLVLCYGEEGVDYTFDENGEIVMAEGKSPTSLGDIMENYSSLLDKVSLEAVLGINAESNSVMRFLAYGTEDVNYRIVDGKIEMLVNPITGERFAKKKLTDLTGGDLPINDAKIGDLMELDDSSSALLKAIKDWTISDLTKQSRIERLKIGQVINLGDNPSSLIKLLADWRIKDLTDQNKIDSITLSDILTIDESSPMLLQKLKNAQLGELGDKTNNLRLLDLLGAEDIAGNKLLRSLGQSTLKTLSSDIQKLSVRDVFGDELYSYMDISNGTYADLLNGYNALSEEESSKVPVAITGATITTHYSVGNQELIGGWFTPVGNRYQILVQSDVYRNSDEENAYYTELEANLIPEISLKRVDYDNGGELVSASYGTAKTGADGTVPTVQGVPYLDGEGRQLYFYTERKAYIDGAETDRTEAVYYPLWKDGNGVYCVNMTIDGKLVRTDFEEAVTGYRTEDGTLLALGEKSSTVKYKGEDTRFYTRDAVIEDGVEIEAKSYYLLEKQTAYYAYYAESDLNEGTVSKTYKESDDGFTTYWTAIKEGQTQAVEVDRYLSGAWWLLFGVEIDGDKHNEVDNTALSILDISSGVSGAANTLQSLQFWELYFHGFLGENPYVELPPLPNTKPNLNLMTLDEVIAYIQTISKGSIVPGTPNM